jgi:hypothetical protein
MPFMERNPERLRLRSPAGPDASNSWPVFRQLWDCGVVGSAPLLMVRWAVPPEERSAERGGDQEGDPAEPDGVVQAVDEQLGP